jgi:hypothetical protein
MQSFQVTVSMCILKAFLKEANRAYCQATYLQRQVIPSHRTTVPDRVLPVVSAKSDWAEIFLGPYIAIM